MNARRVHRIKLREEEVRSGYQRRQRGNESIKKIKGKKDSVTNILVALDVCVTNGLMIQQWWARVSANEFGQRTNARPIIRWVERGGQIGIHTARIS